MKEQHQNLIENVRKCRFCKKVIDTTQCTLVEHLIDHLVESNLLGVDVQNCKWDSPTPGGYEPGNNDDSDDEPSNPSNSSSNSGQFLFF